MLVVEWLQIGCAAVLGWVDWRRWRTKRKESRLDAIEQKIADCVSRHELNGQLKAVQADAALGRAETTALRELVDERFKNVNEKLGTIEGRLVFLCARQRKRKQKPRRK